MPRDLILVRHGESEGNVALHTSKAGDDRWMVHEGMKERHSSWWRLTDAGVAQAVNAGTYIREHIAQEFDQYYVSSYTRAMETAALLDLPNADWVTDPRLRERERGYEDLLSSEERALLVESIAQRKSAPLYWRPVGGESIMDSVSRTRDLLGTFNRELDGKSVVCTCHGEVMESFLVAITRLTPRQFAVWSDDPAEKINNCQVWHFTRQMQGESVMAPRFTHWRSIDTITSHEGEWKAITRPRFSNEELLTEARSTPRIIS